MPHMYCVLCTDVCSMKFTVIYMQTSQKMFFIDIYKCDNEVRYYIKLPPTASWGTQFCHWVLGKIWNTVWRSSGGTSLTLPCFCSWITFRQKVVAQRKGGLEWCLKRCQSVILELDTSVSLRPYASCLYPYLNRAPRPGTTVPQSFTDAMFPGLVP